MKSFRQFIYEKSISTAVAKEVGAKLGIDWKTFDLEQFRKGLEVEQEHDDGSDTDVIPGSGNLVKIGKVALAHLKEIPDYYARLDRMEKSAK